MLRWCSFSFGRIHARAGVWTACHVPSPSGNEPRTLSSSVDVVGIPLPHFRIRWNPFQSRHEYKTWLDHCGYIWVWLVSKKKKNTLSPSRRSWFESAPVVTHFTDIPPFMLGFHFKSVWIIFEKNLHYILSRILIFIPI